MFNFTQNGLLKKKKKLIVGMILDVEIDIEVEWMLLNRAEKQIEDLQKQIDENIQKITDEKKKTPMDMEIVKELVKENIRLGYNSPDLIGKSKDPVFGGKMATVKGIVNFHHNKINEKVGEREYYKLRLKGVNRMLETGYMKHFDEIIKSDEEIEFKK